MPTQKIFKQRVRARMTKTGESYTAARRQLLRKAPEATGQQPGSPTADSGADAAAAPDAVAAPGAAAAPEPAAPAEAFGVADDAMLRATGKRHAEWFAILDAWRATERGHTEIARWLHDEQGAPNWWTQSITVAYERARGMRARHQMSDGFSVSANRTVGVGAERLLAAFTDEALRRTWLPDGSMRRRPTRAALSARFDWADPSSRIVVIVLDKGPAKATVSVSHEQLPDADSAERLKSAWRERLGALKSQLERD